MPEIDLTPYLPPTRVGRPARWVEAREAVAAIPDRSRIFIAGAEMIPNHLLQALDDVRDRYTRLDVANAGLTSRPVIFDHPGEPFWYTTTHATPAYKYLWDTGTVEVIPARYSDLATLFAPDGPLPADVALIQTRLA